MTADGTEEGRCDDRDCVGVDPALRIPGRRRRALLSAFAIAAVRRRRGGARFGQLVDVTESEWFSAGKVFFAVLVGIAGSWASAYVGGTRSGLAESVPLVFPLGILASFAVCRYAREGRGPMRMRVKLCGLVPAPLAFGAVTTGW